MPNGGKGVPSLYDVDLQAGTYILVTLAQARLRYPLGTLSYGTRLRWLVPGVQRRRASSVPAACIVAARRPMHAAAANNG